MSCATAFFCAILISGVLQGLVGGQQTATDENQGISISYGNYLKPRREQMRAAPNDGDEIQGGFTPLPSLGPPEYASPSFQVAERPPLQKPHQFNRLRPKPVTPEGPQYQFGYGQPSQPHRPPRPSFFNRFY